MGGGPSTQIGVPNEVGWVPNEFKEYDPSRSKVINVYKSLDRLKKGGYGTVYKVEHLGTNKIFALKFIPITEDVDNAKREAEIMKKISHESVVKVHSSFPLLDPKGKDVMAHCIVMAFVEGKDLRDYMQRLETPLPKNYVMEAFIKLAEALAYLHKSDIFHCDLKPENIIITDVCDGIQVTIVDFGSAGHKFGNEATNTPMMSTKSYMAPELIKSTATTASLNGKADMWSLGCILYEIWTQDSSFVNVGFGMATKLGKEEDLLNKLGDIAIVLMLKMLLEPSPEKRTTADKLLEHPIFQGWRVAIDEQHSEKKIDYHRVLVGFECTLSIIRFISQSSDTPSISLALRIIDDILTHMYGTQLAYQICTNPIGMSTLLKRKSFNEILKLLRYSFGHATLQRCFAIDNMTETLMRSNMNDNLKIGLGLYEDLPKTSVPLSLYLEKLGKITSDTSIKMSFIADLLNKHRDLPELLAEGKHVYNKMEELLCNCLSDPKSKHIPHLLTGVS